MRKAYFNNGQLVGLIETPDDRTVTTNLRQNKAPLADVEILEVDEDVATRIKRDRDEVSLDGNKKIKFLEK